MQTVVPSYYFNTILYVILYIYLYILYTYFNKAGNYIIIKLNIFKFN